ncbi:HdeD family acid-resistance protein [Baekduia sp.]|uniref:HdeD family acid-resistance protein n=1 Tax=Baekduia sp. TaxID=2600305 RepID=UPI002D1FC09E|nr:DUF308 domain-containing protein [Baekduia sp.]
MAVRVDHPAWKWWWLPMVVGILSVIAGVLAIVWPGITLLALALILGINLAVLSAFTIADALSDDADPDDRTLRIVLGVSGIIGGMVILRRPGDTLLVLVVAAGVWLVMAGVLELIRTFTLDDGHRLFHAFGGIVDLVIGVLILALPDLGLATLAVLVAISFIFHGVLLTATGWRLRQLRAEEARPGRTPVSPTPA